MTDPQREESESGKFSWWTHVKNMPIAALSTVYDVLTAKYSLCVSRGCGKSTFSEEYAASQTGTIIISSAAGYVIHVVGVFVVTKAINGEVAIDYLGDQQKIFRFYAEKYQQSAEDDFAYKGAPGESVMLTTTTDDKKLFIAVNYRIVAAAEGDYNDLTVADFQDNRATGTATNADNINDNAPYTYAQMDVVGEYCEIAFSKAYRLNKYRHLGLFPHDGTGRYKVQYFNLTTGAWTDWVTDIPTRLGSWSEWIEGTAIVTTKVRIITTVLDIGASGNFPSEWEMKYES